MASPSVAEIDAKMAEMAAMMAQMATLRQQAADAETPKQVSSMVPCFRGAGGAPVVLPAPASFVPPVGTGKGKQPVSKERVAACIDAAIYVLAAEQKSKFEEDSQTMR